MRRSLGRALLAAFLLSAGCARHAAPPPVPTPTPKPTRVPVYSLLDGVQIQPKSGDHRIAAVMIDNYPRDARPQSGLRDADIIYEVEAEGGITRYMALYLEGVPAKIGPVRSARTYFVDLARPYNPLFAHAGENNDVWAMLADLRESGFADMDQIVGTPEAFWRDSVRDMPHNLYTSIPKMRATAPIYGYKDMPFDAEEFAFAPDPEASTPADPASAEPAPPANPDPAMSPSPRPTPSAPPDAIVTFWNNYTVRFHPTTGGYERVIKGVVQHDLENPTPYKVADVIAVWIPAKVLDALGDLQMDVYGSFPAVLIRDGKAFTGTWVAPSPDTMPRLVDKDGEWLPLAAGQIYIEVLPQGGTVRNGKNVWSY
jgi:hypothetical protein